MTNNEARYRYFFVRLLKSLDLKAKQKNTIEGT